jgi:lysophospholipase L1-like esterase
MKRGLLLTLALRMATATAPLSLVSCGGGSSPPNSPGGPSEPGFTVVAVVYYDENGDGQAGTVEHARIPDVEVAAGSHSARSEKSTGRAVLSGVPAGAQTVSLRPDTLPPFYRAGAAASIQVPLGEGSQVLLPVTLPIGPDSRPDVYMAFGDSLTKGEGFGGGYPARLEALLRAHFADALVVNRGADATNSYEARERLRRNLAGSLPAMTLILYGTNDWHIPGCQNDPSSCPTPENLRIVVQGVKEFGSLPFLATIPPVNPAVNPGRNDWVAAVNNRIRPVAGEEGAFLVDLFEAFRKRSDLPSLFSDDVHLNDAGYQVMAEAFFEAIAHGRSVPP